MKDILKAGDMKQFRFVVKPEDVATFQGAIVHQVCSTFALAREIEWTTRQFVLDMKDDREEGVGTYLEIHHAGPAFVGEEIVITGVLEHFLKGDLTCSFEARVGERLVANGKTGQKILTLEKIRSIFAHE